MRPYLALWTCTRVYSKANVGSQKPLMIVLGFKWFEREERLARLVLNIAKLLFSMIKNIIF